jgi:predicted nicotinamide N-methyase
MPYTPPVLSLNPDLYNYQSMSVNDTILHYAIRSDIVDDSVDDGRIDATHDVIAGVYEGGMKIWECSVDIIRFFVENHETLFGHDKDHPNHHPHHIHNHVSILELGSGHSLPSIQLSKYFTNPLLTLSDYNLETFRNVTVPNVIRNRVDVNRCRFYYGDWWTLPGSCSEAKVADAANTSDAAYTNDATDTNDGNTNDGKYDYIIASETMYNTHTSKQTLQLIKKHLSSSGKAFVGTKRFYFGVGGGSNIITDHCEEYGLKVDDVVVKDNGRGNIREVFVLVVLE